MKEKSVLESSEGVAPVSSEQKPKASLTVKLLIIPVTLLAVYLAVVGAMSRANSLPGEAVGAGFGPVLFGLLIVGIMQVSKVNRNQKSRYQTFLIMQGVVIFLQLKALYG